MAEGNWAESIGNSSQEEGQDPTTQVKDALLRLSADLIWRTFVNVEKGPLSSAKVRRFTSQVAGRMVDELEKTGQVSSLQDAAAKASDLYDTVLTEFGDSNPEVIEPYKNFAETMRRIKEQAHSVGTPG